RFLPPSHLGSVTLTDSLLCDGCYIEGGEIRNSVIGIRTVIGENVLIERSVLMGAEKYHKVGEGDGHCTVDDGSVIRNAIIDRDVRIGRRVRLENRDNLQEYDDGLVEIRDGVIVVPKGTEIPEGYVL
ncbi:MAG: glucose-1-phosphate adenylyltransferase, partial [Candidatus Cloacimonetes bacterium]|nr:glucose-1-phosphate adenylyltransferase [Candidatus Cloacimonadota bacterium]